MSIVIGIITTVLAIVLGQMLVKKGMTVAGPSPSSLNELIFYLIKNMVLNPYIVVGLFVSVISTLSWMYVLSKAELSFAYPFTSVTFPLVLLLSALVFGESISLQRWIGIILLVVGLIFVSKS